MQTTRLEESASYQSYPCIWMQCGVVRKKYCRTNFDCTLCPYDRALKNIAMENKKTLESGKIPEGKRKKIVFWKDKLLAASSSPFRLPCIHSMKRRINFRPCFQDYQCGSCEFDQFFHDEFTVRTITKPIDVMDINGFKMPQGYYLHEGHAWVKIEEDAEVRVGLDDFIMKTMGPMDRIESPLIGQIVEQNRSDILIERGGNKAQVRSPVSGVVTAVNSKLMEQANIANKAPYTEGWLIRVHAKNIRRDLKNLVIGRESKNLLSEDVDRLVDLIEVHSGPLAADGGQLVDDIYGNMPQIGWKRLTRLFLHT